MLVVEEEAGGGGVGDTRERQRQRDRDRDTERERSGCRVLTGKFSKNTTMIYVHSPPSRLKTLPAALSTLTLPL